MIAMSNAVSFMLSVLTWEPSFWIGAHHRRVRKKHSNGYGGQVIEAPCSRAPGSGTSYKNRTAEDPEEVWGTRNERGRSARTGEMKSEVDETRQVQEVSSACLPEQAGPV